MPDSPIPHYIPPEGRDEVESDLYLKVLIDTWTQLRQFKDDAVVFQCRVDALLTALEDEIRQERVRKKVQ